MNEFSWIVVGEEIPRTADENNNAIWMFFLFEIRRVTIRTLFVDRSVNKQQQQQEQSSLTLFESIVCSRKRSR